MNGGAPIRFGLIFKTENNPMNGKEREIGSEGEGEPISSVIATIFNHISSVSRPHFALYFLSNVCFNII